MLGWSNLSFHDLDDATWKIIPHECFRGLPVYHGKQRLCLCLFWGKLMRHFPPIVQGWTVCFREGKSTLSFGSHQHGNESHGHMVNFWEIGGGESHEIGDLLWLREVCKHATYPYNWNWKKQMAFRSWKNEPATYTWNFEQLRNPYHCFHRESSLVRAMFSLQVGYWNHIESPLARYSLSCLSKALCLALPRTSSIRSWQYCHFHDTSRTGNKEKKYPTQH